MRRNDKPTLHWRPVWETVLEEKSMDGHSQLRRNSEIRVLNSSFEIKIIYIMKISPLRHQGIYWQKTSPGDRPSRELLLNISFVLFQTMKNTSIKKPSKMNMYACIYKFVFNHGWKWTVLCIQGESAYVYL